MPACLLALTISCLRAQALLLLIPVSLAKHGVWHLVGLQIFNKGGREERIGGEPKKEGIGPKVENAASWLAFF